MVGIGVLVLIGLIVGASFFYVSMTMPDNSNEDSTDSSNSPISFGQLKINHLFASSDGTVSLNVTLYECDSGIVEAVIINGTNYLWSEGSIENGEILKGQTKSWSKSVGSLNPGDKIEVELQASPENTIESATVQSPIPESPENPETPDKPELPNLPSYYYDYYSTVGLFDRGVYFAATSQNPLEQLARSDLPESYWTSIHENVTNLATDQDFISIAISRGDFPTGGYLIQVKSFSWLESYPVKFSFQVNFTDPGEGVPVTLAFTNPIVLVPIGNLSPGMYEVEVHIVSYILTFDDQGNPVYQPIMTFKEEVWTQTLTIVNTTDAAVSTTFKVIVNTNPFSDLTVPVEVSSSMNREKAQAIADATFSHVKGEETLFRLDNLTFNDKQIAARYTWGIDEKDMGHIFELTVDLMTLQITVEHCF